MKIRNFLMVALILSSFSIIAQKKEITEKHKEFIYKFSYEMHKNIFIAKEYVYKKKKLNLDSIFIRSNNSKEIISSSIDSLGINATIKLKESSFSQNMILESKFPSYFEEQNISNVIDIDVSKSNLLNKLNDTIKLRQGGGTSYGSLLEYRNVGEKVTNLNYRTIYRQSQLLNDTLAKLPIKGHVIYNVKFITDYGYHEITKKNIGVPFKLGETTAILIDLFDNKIILEVLDKTKLSLNNFNVINLDESEENMLMSYSYFELEKLKENDASFKDAKSFRSSMITISKDMYNFFKKNPTITLEQYKK